MNKVLLSEDVVFLTMTIGVPILLIVLIVGLRIAKNNRGITLINLYGYLRLLH